MVLLKNKLMIKQRRVQNKISMPVCDFALLAPENKFMVANGRRGVHLFAQNKITIIVDNNN